MPKPTIQVCFSPDLYHLYDDPEQIVVVIDILRATSAICTAIEHGAESVIPVASLEEAQEYKNLGYLVGAERGGKVVEGFDFGNSPYTYMNDRIKGKNLVLTTTNGTRAIETSKNSHTVVIGSFLNIDALIDWLLNQTRNIVLLCSGWKGKFNLEDSLFAGNVVQRLIQVDAFKRTDDAALCTKYLYEMAHNDPFTFLRKSSHGQRLAKLNLKEDIRYCLQVNKTSKIPVLQDGRLVALDVKETLMS
ncbi:MAG: 2-phosphosulfolactate phosphatase [Flavobacteriales bacterium]|nr:2-phosphosulfolactate phosphatase [Flavobacteriales bacterium]